MDGATGPKTCFIVTGDILADSHSKCFSFCHSSGTHKSILSAQIGFDPCCHVVRISGRHGYCSFRLEAVKEAKGSFIETVKHILLTTSKCANADGPRDAASCKIDHIALPTKYNYQATSVGRYRIAMQTEKCQLLPHIWTIMLKLHLIDLLPVYYTTKFATNTVTNRTNGA